MRARIRNKPRLPSEYCVRGSRTNRGTPCTTGWARLTLPRWPSDREKNKPFVVSVGLWLNFDPLWMLGVAPGFPFECARPYPPGALRVGPRLSSVSCAGIGKAEKNLCIAELGLTLSSELNSAGRRRVASCEECVCAHPAAASTRWRGALSKRQ